MRIILVENRNKQKEIPLIAVLIWTHAYHDDSWSKRRRIWMLYFVK